MLYCEARAVQCVEAWCRRWALILAAGGTNRIKEILTQQYALQDTGSQVMGSHYAPEIYFPVTPDLLSSLAGSSFPSQDIQDSFFLCLSFFLLPKFIASCLATSHEFVWCLLSVLSLIHASLHRYHVAYAVVASYRPLRAMVHPTSI